MPEGNRYLDEFYEKLSGVPFSGEAEEDDEAGDKAEAGRDKKLNAHARDEAKAGSAVSDAQ